MSGLQGFADVEKKMTRGFPKSPSKLSGPDKDAPASLGGCGEYRPRKSWLGP